MSEKWQLPFTGNPKESCATCENHGSCNEDARDCCHQVRYDHECYPMEERYLNFKPRQG